MAMAAFSRKDSSLHKKQKSKKNLKNTTNKVDYPKK